MKEYENTDELVDGIKGLAFVISLWLSVLVMGLVLWGLFYLMSKLATFVGVL